MVGSSSSYFVLSWFPLSDGRILELRPGGREPGHHHQAHRSRQKLSRRSNALPCSALPETTASRLLERIRPYPAAKIMHAHALRIYHHGPRKTHEPSISAPAVSNLTRPGEISGAIRVTGYQIKNDNGIELELPKAGSGTGSACTRPTAPTRQGRKTPATVACTRGERGSRQK